MTTQILRSAIDRSINFVRPAEDGGFIEARSVQRTDETLIVYLSSMSGCNLSCRMCHLTQTGQTTMRPVPTHGYVEQVEQIFELLEREDKLDGVEQIHYNFMARGDPLSNQEFITSFSMVHSWLRKMALKYKPHANVQFKISTIFPKDGILHNDPELGKMWIANFMLGLDDQIEFYYSLYSLKPKFRKRWLPKALDPELVGAIFSGMDQGLRLHHALIAGENDSEEDIALIHDWLERHDLHVMMNIVRYNPYDESAGRETDAETIQTYVNQMKLSHRITNIQIIPRVGEDCKASCGMFYNG